MENHVHQHEIRYFVDTEELVATQSRLTVAEILEAAKLDPSTHYLVEIRGHEQIPRKDIREVLHLHENERFISVSTGPTPVS